MLININHLTSARLQAIKCTRFKWMASASALANSVDGLRVHPAALPERANGDEHPIRIISTDDHKGTISRLAHTDRQHLKEHSETLESVLQINWRGCCLGSELRSTNLE